MLLLVIEGVVVTVLLLVIVGVKDDVADAVKLMVFDGVTVVVAVYDGVTV